MQRAKQILKNMRMKSTAGRQGILAALQQTDTPLDISEIKTYLHKQHININLATIYRTINTFVKAGLVHQIEFQEGKFRYEFSSLPHHHHAVCTKCGSVEDIQNCDMGDMEEKVRKAINFKVTNHTSEFYGVCRKCQ